MGAQPRNSGVTSEPCFTDLIDTESAMQLLSSLSNGKKAVAVLLWLVSHLSGAVQNPRDNFCRRYAHQTTVIDDKLYIDGGYVNFDSFPQDHLDVPSKYIRC